MFYLIGKPLGHSYSPQIHGMFNIKDYALKEIDEDNIAEFINKKDFDGLNVTIPYKKTVIPFLDEVSPRAKAIGAVNTIRKNKDGSLFGDNTDIAGFEYLAQIIKLSFKNKKLLILGSGGTAQMARYAAQKQGAKEVVFVSRSGECNYNNVYNQKNVDIIVNASPVGMYPNVLARSLNLSLFSNLEAVIDVIYNPMETMLIQQAKALGIKAISGLAMLVQQARVAQEIFLNKPIDESQMQRVLKQMLQSRTNIVLVGMPGSGKSSIGEALANIMKREHIDTDALIVQNTNMNIADIFANYGEVKFRQLEQDAVLSACTATGKVISLGGGAVLSEQNRNAMLMNGRIYHINRPIEALSMEGRPLSKSLEELKNMEAKRRPLYNAVSHKVVENIAGIDTLRDIILEDFYENTCY